jgi:hypothetical protein
LKPTTLSAFNALPGSSRFTTQRLNPHDWVYLLMDYSSTELFQSEVASVSFHHSGCSSFAMFDADA